MVTGSQSRVWSGPYVPSLVGIKWLHDHLHGLVIISVDTLEQLYSVVQRSNFWLGFVIKFSNYLPISYCDLLSRFSFACILRYLLRTNYIPLLLGFSIAQTRPTVVKTISLICSIIYESFTQLFLPLLPWFTCSTFDLYIWNIPLSLAYELCFAYLLHVIASPSMPPPPAPTFFNVLFKLEPSTEDGNNHRTQYVTCFCVMLCKLCGKTFTNLIKSNSLCLNIAFVRFNS